MRLFDRRCRLTIETLEASDLDVQFKIQRSLFQRAGTAEITVYNLSPEHRARVQNYRTRVGAPPNDRWQYARVRLEAGHADGTSVLFQGNARRIYSTREQPQWITKVTAGDGEDALRAARARRAFGPDASLTEVARHVAEAMGLGLGNTVEQLANTALGFPGGAVVHGRAAPQLTRLLAAAGFEWSVQDGVLQVLPRGGALGRTAVLLDADHGLLEGVEVGINRVVTCKAILQPDLVPGAQVRLESVVARARGYFRIEQCEYAGDTRSAADWTAALEMRRIRADGSIEGVNPP